LFKVAPQADRPRKVTLADDKGFATQNCPDFHQNNALWRDAGPDKAMRDGPCARTKFKRGWVPAFLDMLGNELTQYWRGWDDGAHLRRISKPSPEKLVRGVMACKLI
jgi:hypothetical protein